MKNALEVIGLMIVIAVVSSVGSTLVVLVTLHAGGWCQGHSPLC